MMRRDQMGSQNPNSELDSSYADSVGSSPRSVGRGRGTDSEYSGASQRWDDSSPRVRFMCSHGGRILPRPHDNQLRYVGGDTRIVAVNRNISYSVLIGKLSRLCGSNVTLKYQLPNEDLDALISVTTDEDLDNMMDEYDRLQQLGNKSSRLRLFLFPANLETATSLGSLLEGSKREHWFVDALNGAPLLARGRSEASSVVSEMPDYLFGLDNIEDWDREDRSSHKATANPPPRKSRMSANPQEGMNQQSPEVHSAPGSPIPDSSPYCSTSSAPPCMNSQVVSMADLPPVKVKSTQGLVDESGDLQQRYDTAPSDGGSDIHNGQDVWRPPSNSSVDSTGVQEIGLRTQDPRLIFDDHMTKINYQGKPITNNSPERAKNRLNSPDGERQIPVQEFQQVQISGKHQPENLRPDDVVEEHARYDSPRNTANPVSESPEGGQSTLRNEGSQSDLAGMKREGSGSSLSASGDEIRNLQKQDEINPIAAKKDKKSPDAGIKVIPNPQKPIQERRTVEEDFRPDQIYSVQKPEVTVNPAEHYMGLPQDLPVSHFVQPGQAVSYWQVHDPQLQQSEQAIPIYLVPAPAPAPAPAAGPSPVLQTMTSSVRPSGQAGYIPVQRMGMAPMNAPAVYSGDMLSSKPVNAVQAPLQRPTTEIPQKVVGVTVPGKIPVYRGRAVPPPTEMRMMMRPPQPVASPVMQIPQDQYAYQPVFYETNPPQVYYTQKAAPVVNAQYQGLIPVNADLQPTSDMLPDQPKLARVSQSL